MILSIQNTPNYFSNKIYEKNQQPISQPQISKFSPNFGIKISTHAYDRIIERKIDFTEVISALIKGKKFPQQDAIMHINQTKDGTVKPETVIAITSADGSKLLTAYRNNAKKMKIQKGQLKFKKEQTNQDIEVPNYVGRIWNLDTSKVESNGQQFTIGNFITTIKNIIEQVGK